MKRILLLDNYDSFTFIIYDYLLRVASNAKVEVYRNDTISLDHALSYDALVLSPGPGLPEEAGIMSDLLRNWDFNKPCLGICLGLQAIGLRFGGQLMNLDHVYHGVKRLVTVIDHEDPILNGLPKAFNVGRYHSWVIDPYSVTIPLIVSSIDDQSQIMTIYHKDFPCFGVQFHPESIMTECGLEMIKNFVKVLSNSQPKNFSTFKV